MNLPANAYGVGVLLVLVLPGVVWMTVRTAVRGRVPHDRDIAARVLQALVVSAILDTVYVLAFGSALVDGVKDAGRGQTPHPRLAAAALLFLAVALPAALAYVFRGRPTWTSVPTRLGDVRLPLTSSGYDSAPTAWDKKAPGLGGHWIRIRIADQTWIGGWYGNDSYISTYPEPRDIFIEDQHHVAADGTIGSRVDGSAGVWLAVKDGDVVEWIDP